MNNIKINLNAIEQDIKNLSENANKFYLDNIPHFCITVKADDIVVEKFLACSHIEVVQEFFKRLSINRNLIYAIHEGVIQELTAHYCDKQGNLQPLNMRFTYGININ